MVLEGPGAVWLQSRDFESAHPPAPQVTHTKTVVRKGPRRREWDRERERDDARPESWIWDGHRSD